MQRMRGNRWFGVLGACRWWGRSWWRRFGLVLPALPAAASCSSCTDLDSRHTTDRQSVFFEPRGVELGLTFTTRRTRLRYGAPLLQGPLDVGHSQRSSLGSERNEAGRGNLLRDLFRMAAGGTCPRPWRSRRTQRTRPRSSSRTVSTSPQRSGPTRPTMRPLHGTGGAFADPATPPGQFPSTTSLNMPTTGSTSCSSRRMQICRS